MRNGQCVVVRTSDGRYSISEGETDIHYEDKTYFYISNKDAARMEVQHFQD